MLCLLVLGPHWVVAETIPLDLVGVWSSDVTGPMGSPNYADSQTLYLCPNGVGAIVSGHLAPPLDIKFNGSFNEKTNQLEFVISEGPRRGHRGHLNFDPKTQIFDAGPPKHRAMRRVFGACPPEIIDGMESLPSRPTQRTGNFERPKTP